MIELTPNEARALGVLIEKAFTTPEQYPLSINALTGGANQKNNRDPVLSLPEDEVFNAVESLREKQLAVRVDAIGSRVHKYKHVAGEALRCKAGELAILAELMLRGPQTLGELRGRANRMQPIATLDDAKMLLRGLKEQQEPLVRELPAEPGTRAEKYAQLLSPASHAVPPAQATTAAVAAPASGGGGAAGGSSLAERVARLETDVAELRKIIDELVGPATPSSSATPAMDSQPQNP